jgi:thiol-disulfide isomerase/thioredoxin
MIPSSYRALGFVGLAAVAGWVLPPLAAAEFRGKLNPAVEPGTRALSAVVPAPAEVIAALPTAPGPDDRVWALSRPLTIKGKTFLMAVYAGSGGDKTLWLDRDVDGKFGPEERWPFAADSKLVSLTLPWDNGIYREFPIRFEWSAAPMRRGPAAAAAPAAPPATSTTVTSLVYNFNILFAGSVDVEGRTMRVMFAPKPADSVVDPANQRGSMDANFNGEFEPAIGEAVNAAGKIPVFRSGSRYLAVKSVDMKTGEIVVEERPAADYTRFDAAPGQEFPDFAFTDFNGGRHKLSDFRGKVVLLDFWGTWCGPCIEEMKHLDPLYAQYGPKGFEVIGMNMERTAGRLTSAEYVTVTEKARAFIAKAGHKWVQATQESIERVAIDVVHVNAYPTCILIGADGKVLSREARGQVLADLLAKHLP